MQSIDITSSQLTEHGFTLRKEAFSIVVIKNENGFQWRFQVYPKDWNKTTRVVENKLEEATIPIEVIQLILKDMSANYGDVVGNGNGKSSSTTTTAVVEPPPEKLEDMTYEEWQSKLIGKHQAIHAKIKTSVMPLPQLTPGLDFALSVKNVLNLLDNTLPFAGFLLGAPSSLKTVIVELFRSYWHSIYRDDFSPKAFVSHYSGSTKEELGKNDLLPMMQHKLFLTPELAPLFTGSEDDIKKAFGLLTRLLDGKGLETHSGTQGVRGYHGEYMFAWLGAVVDVSARVHRMMGNLGPKMYFLRLAKSYHSEKDLIAQLTNPRFVKDLKGIEQLLIEYLKWFEASPIMKDKHGLPKVIWDDDKNDMNAIKYIAKLADLIGPLRGVAEVQDTEDSFGSSYAYSNKIIEEPWRANQQLYNLARGHALITGRNYITMDDVPLLIKVVLSTAPIARVAVFDLLLGYGGTLKTAQIKEALGINPQTVHKTMYEFELLELADVKKDGDFTNSPLEMTLKSKYKWCLGRRFRQLREGFAPARKGRKQASFNKQSSNQGDNVEQDSSKQMKMSGGVNDDFPSTFWIYWNEEEKLHENEPTIEGWKLVSESQLKQRLIASGEFNAGDATQLIKNALDTNRIRKIAWDNLVNNSQANMSTEGK
jgi:hypothetical protein